MLFSPKTSFCESTFSAGNKIDPQAEGLILVVRGGFEPPKACAARFQVPPGYPGARTISSPWPERALGGGRLVSAPSPLLDLRSKSGGAWLRIPLIS